LFCGQEIGLGKAAKVFEETGERKQEIRGWRKKRRKRKSILWSRVWKIVFSGALETLLEARILQELLGCPDDSGHQSGVKP